MNQNPVAEKEERGLVPTPKGQNTGQLAGGEEFPPTPTKRFSSKKKKKSAANLPKVDNSRPPVGYICQFCDRPGHYLSACPGIMDKGKGKEKAVGPEQPKRSDDRSPPRETKGQEAGSVEGKPKSGPKMSAKEPEPIKKDGGKLGKKEGKKAAREPLSDIVLGVTEKKVVGNAAYSEFVQNLFKNRPNTYVNMPKRRTALEMWDEMDQKKLENLEINERDQASESSATPKGEEQTSAEENEALAAARCEQKAKAARKEDPDRDQTMTD